MATNQTIKTAQGLIDTRGVSKQQAQQQYGLSPEDTDWMSKGLGLKFAANTPAASQATGAGYGAATVAAPTSVSAPRAAVVDAQTLNAGATRQGSAAGYNAATAQAAGYNAATAQAAGYDAAQAAAARYAADQGTASLWNVGQRQTVQGQIADITSSDSPLMQQAETRGLQEANRRGLANSSMAVQAGQAALYDAALPIAQQDAGTFAQSAQFNAGQRQQMTLQNLNSTNRSREFNAGNRQQVGMFNADSENRSREFTAGNRQEANLFNANSRNQARQFTASESNDRDALNAQLGTQVAVGNADRATQVAVGNADRRTDTSRFNAGANLQAQLANQEATDRRNQFNATQTNEARQFTATLNADISKFNASESNDLKQLGMDSQTRVGLANIEASYKTLMQTSASAGDLYKSVIGNVATILANKDMNGAAKSRAITTLIDGLNASLGVVGDIANMDFPELSFDGSSGDITTPPSGGKQPGKTPGKQPTGGAGKTNFPSKVEGQSVDWDAESGGAFGSPRASLRDQYEEYAMSAGASALSPSEWYAQRILAPQRVPVETT